MRIRKYQELSKCRKRKSKLFLVTLMKDAKNLKVCKINTTKILTPLQKWIEEKFLEVIYSIKGDFNLIFDAWSKLSTHQTNVAVNLIFNILQKMSDLSNTVNDKTILPDILSYQAALHSLSKWEEEKHSQEKAYFFSVRNEDI